MGLFELDAVPFNDPGPYKHTYLMSLAGVVREQHVAYMLNDWQTPPEQPSTPLNPTDHESVGLWESYRLYRAVLAHEQERREIRAAYYKAVAEYILSTCVSPTDRLLITTQVDYDRVYNAAVVPEVRLEDIDAALASTFQGHME